MTVYVYKITHLDSGRVYVGLTVKRDPLDRWVRHVSEAQKDSAKWPIARAMHAHGADRFQFEVIETVETHAFGVERERYWIARFKETNPSGVYNVRRGGEAQAQMNHARKCAMRILGKHDPQKCAQD